MTVIDQAAIDRYTMGHCSTLAAALHQRTGWPMVPMRDNHVMVEDPSGLLWDILGPQHRDMAEVRWGPVEQWDPWVPFPAAVESDDLAWADAVLAEHGEQN